MGLGNLFSLPIIPIFPYSIIPSFHSFRRKTLTFRLIYFLINQSFLANTGGPLATHASALKRARQSEKKRLRNVSIKSALKTRIAGDKRSHQIGISGDHHGKLSSMIFHLDQQGLNRLIPVPFVAIADETIGLVNKQDSAERSTAGIPYLRCSLPDISSD